MKSEIRVLIADDHPIFRQGLRQVIEKDSSSRIVAEAEDGQTALALMQTTKPDMAILDIEMPKLDGFAVAREFQKKGLAIDIIFLTVSREEEFFDEALEVGAKGYVLKDCTGSDIINCIKTVASGQYYLSPQMSNYVVKRNHPAADLAKKRPGINELTPTERHILKLVAEDKSSKDIADILCVSHRTIETHRTNICNKLDIHGHHALLKFALLHRSEL